MSKSRVSLAGDDDGVSALMADLVRRRVSVIATLGGDPTAIAAKAATATIPIVFGTSEDPVKLGLVASLARSGGNATGVNFLNTLSRRLALLHHVARICRHSVAIVENKREYVARKSRNLRHEKSVYTVRFQ
jgi:putative tryptophan/tyrosine transport system substrate-binding protein